jgi:tetratricopeptide (TPR) repeat protein
LGRTRLIVAAAALVAAAATIGIVLLTRDEPEAVRSEPLPLFLDLGTRTDAEARALRRAAGLYERGALGASRAIFDRYPSPEAAVGSAFARWPEDPTGRLRELPQSGVALLHLGIALADQGREAEARAALERAERVAPDSLYAIRADDFQYPRMVPGLPFFVPSREPTPALRRALRLHVLGRPLSARAACARAARAAPNDPEALTADAVARFDKDDPAAAFSRLGPLSRHFPHAATVRFHLGLLLLWSGRVAEGKRQLGLVRTGRLEMEAKRILVRLENVK